MASPMIATKMYVPKPRRGLVRRPRLRERLRKGSESRLTLVSAPAGFGKTTLLAEWLDQTSDESSCVAWVSLDSSDSEPASFWTYVVTALQTVVPEIGAGALETIATSPLPTESVLTTLVNELAVTPDDVWLVLDDYHLVDSREIGDGVVFVLEHLPPNLHVVISSRVDPDLPLSRWRARGELVEIRAADLRFTAQEAAAYLNGTKELDLAAEDVAVLEERTEGWIAALQLAALSIQGREDITGFIARFAGNDRYVFDYLVEEVLQQQPDSVRRFLLESAVLGRLTGSLCDAVTGRDDGAHMLRSIERANLFIVPLDDRREWYRYHHLFADALRARMLSEKPELVPVLHQRASGWYERRDLAEDAIWHAVAARDFDRAARLMELALSANRRNRRDAMLFGWLKALPDDAVRRNPVLSVFYGWMLMIAGDLESVEPRYRDAERALASVPAGSASPWADTQELQTLPATIAVHRASLAQARGDVDGTAEHARSALGLVGPDDHLARANAAGLLGLAAWARGDASTALQTFAEVVTSLQVAGNLADALSGTVVLADMWLAAGRPSEARRSYDRALHMAESQEPLPQATADLHVGLSELDREVGSLENAKRHLEVAAALEKRASMTENRYRRFVSMGRVAEAEGDPEGAISLLDRAEGLYVPGFFPYVRPIAAMKARVWIAQENLQKADDWARARGVSALDDVNYLREFDHLTLVRLLIARHRTRLGTGGLDDALRLLDRLADAADAERAGSLLEIRMLRALALDAQGHRPQAIGALDHAWSAAPEPDGYARLFLDEGQPMIGLLGDTQHQGLAAEQAGRLLRLHASSRAGVLDPGRRPVGLSSTVLSERELQVLRLLNSELSAPEIARELFISYNTVRTHTKHIFTKLGVSTRPAAVRRARERGWM